MSKDNIFVLFERLSKADLRERNELRKMIADEASRLTNPEVLKPYITHDNFVVREITADALGEIQHKSSIEFLRQMLRVEEDTQVQMAIMYAMQKIDMLPVIILLMEIAKDGAYSELVRSLAIDAIGTHMLKNIISPILEILAEADEQGYTQIFDAIFDMFAGIENSEMSITSNLLNIIDRVDISDKLKLHIIIYAGERRFVESVDKLSSFLNHKDPDLRHAAVKSLGNIGDPKSIFALKSKLNDADDDVKQAVNTVLTKFLHTSDDDFE